MSSNDEIRIEPDLEERIEAFAFAMGSTPSEIVRQAFVEFEAAHRPAPENGSPGESAYATLLRAGLIGCVKNGAKDLSTNQAYLEDMGRD